MDAPDEPRREVVPAGLRKAGLDLDQGRVRAPAASRARVGAAMAFAAILSVQCGAALATTLFDSVGPQGAVLMRSTFGALALLAVARPSLGAIRAGPLREVVLFGVALAAVNLSFYAALDRLPLGIAVTLEFVGPLGVAVLGSRRWQDAIWALLAAVGILLLSHGSGSEGIDPLGVVLALTAGAFWALYILQSARVGSSYPGLSGLAVAATISALIVAPLGVWQGGGELLVPANLAVGLAVGLLSSAIPFRSGVRGPAPSAERRIRGPDEHRARGGGIRRLHRSLPGIGADRGARNRTRCLRLRRGVALDERTGSARWMSADRSSVGPGHSAQILASGRAPSPARRIPI